MVPNRAGWSSLQAVTIKVTADQKNKGSAATIRVGCGSKIAARKPDGTAEKIGGKGTTAVSMILAGGQNVRESETRDRELCLRLPPAPTPSGH